MLENDDGAGQIIAKPHKHVSFPKDENFKDEIVTWPSSSKFKRSLWVIFCLAANLAIDHGPRFKAAVAETT